MMGIPRGRRKGRIGDDKKGSSGIIEVVGEEDRGGSNQVPGRRG